jgi:hypothetical protein
MDDGTEGVLLVCEEQPRQSQRRSKRTLWVCTLIQAQFGITGKASWLLCHGVNKLQLLS